MLINKPYGTESDVYIYDTSAYLLEMWISS